MSRRAQTLLNAATAASLLFALTSLFMWGRSVHRYDAVTIGRADLRSFPQKLTVLVSDRPEPIMFVTQPTAFPASWWDLRPSLHPGRGRIPAALVLPYWLPASAGLCLPLARAAFRWRRPRPLAGHCTSCNYDLRASPDRCPECGKASAQ